METTENPYASPTSPHDPAIQTRIQSLKWLRVAGAGILILAAMEVTGAVAALIMDLIVLALLSLGLIEMERPLWQELLIFFIIVAILSRAIVMVIGARHMRTGKSYCWAKWGSIITIIGGIYPFFWLDLGFGIWAFLLLRKQKYKAMFEIGPPSKLGPIVVATITERPTL
jgi:energy-converting hydrogenase Eha subunit A